MELGRVLGAQAELALDRPRLESLRARRDDEARDPARPGFAGAREHERPRRPRAERDEHLLAAEDEPVAVAVGARLERAGIRPGAGLGERVTAELLTCREWRQQAPALLVGPPPGDRLPVQAVRDRDDPPHVRVGSPELLDEERVRDHVQAEPAVLLGQRRGEEAQRGQLADDPRSIASPRSHSAAFGAISASQNDRAV